MIRAFWCIGLWLFLLLPAKSNGQDVPITMEPSAVTGDSLPTVWLMPVDIQMSKRAYRRYQKKYNRLSRYIQKVYPYAQLAGEIINEYEVILDTISNERARKHMMQVAEDDLKREFEDELKSFTFSQGRILIKLIDRQTGKTTYELIQNMRGNFSAFMWQGVARIFGSNLKSEYDPEEDFIIEQVILQIDKGLIPVKKLKRKSTQIRKT
ncbi:MAG: hypothetical protein ACI9YL_000242 [Luteibaculaceae bacterium]|jgi:hypothetical protein